MPRTKSAVPSAAPAVVSATDILGGMAMSKPTAKGKPEKPQLRDPSLDDSIASYIENKQAEETAKALASAAADQIKMTAGPFRLAECVKAGSVLSSIDVNGKLTFTQQNRYSVVPQERAEALEKSFGTDYPRFFKAQLSIALKETSANDEAVLTQLVKLLGPEFIEANFDIRRDLLVQDSFHTAYSTRPDVQNKARPFLDDQTIKPYSASLKVK